MIKVIVLYREAPEPGRYAEHVELTKREVPTARLEHGRIFGSPAGPPNFQYVFEFEFEDMDAFRAAGAALQRLGEDAQSMGVPFEVYFAEVA